jgi:prepilin-type N-terminal cleavage/methylation domain-containing protein
MKIGQNVSRIARRSLQGFTLIEAMISLLIISFLVVSLSAGIGYGFKTDQLVREDARATQILNEKIDKLRLCTWEQLRDRNYMADNFYCAFNPEDAELGDEGVTNLKGAGRWKRQDLNYEGKITLTNGPSDVVYGTNMMGVTVSLEWTSSTGLKRQRSMTTYVAKYGIQNYAL